MDGRSEPGAPMAAEVVRQFPVRARRSRLSLAIHVAAILVGCGAVAVFVMNNTGIPIWLALKAHDDRMLCEIVRLQGIRALPHLGWALRSEYPDERSDVVLALTCMEPKSAGVRLLIAALDDADIRVRSGALETLARLGPEGSAAVPKLALLLDDPRSAIRYGAVQALGSIGSEARQVAGKLRKLSHDESDPDFHHLADLALSMVLGDSGKGE